MLVAVLLTLLGSGQPHDSSVVGEYYQGDGTGTNWYLSLKPDDQYSFKWVGCLGEYGQSEGQWSVEGGQLKLHARKTAGMAEKLPGMYEIIRWGDRTYLVPSGEMIAFCNYINQGSEPRAGAHGSVFLKDGDWNQEAAGRPTLPARFLAFLLAKPVRARIVSSDGAHGTIDAGRRAGLRVGMVLTLQDGSVDQVRVTSSSEDSATVESLYGKRLSGHAAVSTLLFDATLRQ